MSNPISISRIAVALLVVFLVVLAFVRPHPWWSSGDTIRGGIAATHTEIQVLAMLLDEYFQSNRNLLPTDNALTRTTLWKTSTTARDFLTCVRTNSAGEMVDYWDVPFQIQFIQTTNFVIRSAGPNKKFGDQDDLIYDSTK